ncbi:MAG: 1-deoxy-D-xylulose-5-phosphate reductoisomerase [Candidatus Puniceispirillum sp.]|nr:1-deoxy-D-xylulose-5-phosphate reductoisomerase [Candidatus Puniceispirillum sp.]
MSVTKTITVMGATGSIGQSTLALVRQFSELFSVQALVAGSDAEGLAALAREFRPKMIGLHDLTKLDQLRSALTDIDVEIIVGEAGCTQIAASPVDMVVAGIVGIAGLPSVLAAVQSGQTIALANKEALVSAGGLVMREAARCGAHILPVDSEHNAVFQCWQGWNGHASKQLGQADTDLLSHICLTASGGPFLHTPLDDLPAMTPQQAVRHPNWSMGQKISVDSATMMNKGLEVIEAYWLFGLQPDQIEVLIHPQQAVHGMIYFRDGSVLAQLAGADMRTPISYALAWPERLQWADTRLDLSAIGQLSFEAVDMQRFPCFALARQALRDGGAAPAILNAANEVAVAAFLQGKIGFTRIAAVVDTVLDQSASAQIDSLEAVMAIDAASRDLALAAVTKNQSYLSD